MRIKTLGLFVALDVCVLLGACEDDSSRRPGRDADISVSFEAGVLSDAPSMDAAISPIINDAGANEAGVDSQPMGASFYVSPLGSDTNTGTVIAPLKTISKALFKAATNDTVWLLDGVWDGTIDPVLSVATAAPCSKDAGLLVPAGVTLASVNPRQAIIRATGSYGACLRGGTIKNVHFDRPTGQGGHIDVRGEGNVIEGSTFSGVYGCGGSGWEAAVYVDSMAKLTLSGGGFGESVTDGLGCQFLTVRGGSEVNVKQLKIAAGKSAATSGSATIIVVDGSSVRLSGVSLFNTGTATRGVNLGVGRVDIEMASEIRGFTDFGISVRGVNPTIAVSVTDSLIKNNGLGIGVEYGYGGSATIVANNAVFEGNRVGIYKGTGTGADVRLQNTRVIGQTQTGIQLDGQGKVDIAGGEVSANAIDGVSVATGAPGTCNVKLRNVKVMNNKDRGVNVVCYADSVVDLGTASSLGGNTLTGNAAGLAINTSGFSTTAIGNTWEPAVQNANAQGKYEVTGAGAKLDVTSGMGANYRITQGALRLAENP